MTSSVFYIILKRSARISVRTLNGMSDEFIIKNTVMHGTVWAHAQWTNKPTATQH